MFNHSHFRRMDLYQVLTSVDQSIRQTVLDTGFGNVELEFSPADRQTVRIIVKNTVYDLYAVSLDEVQQLLRSGPHFPDHYISQRLWDMLGIILNTILGEQGTQYGHISLEMERKNHQQRFLIHGAPSYQLYLAQEAMNL
ncbi:hypothetical protein [Adonisia turfae]|nr:hypothetical protein [Adonisia turfae]